MTQRVGCIFFTFFWLIAMLGFAILLPEIGAGGWILGGSVLTVVLVWISISRSRPQSSDF